MEVKKLGFSRLGCFCAVIVTWVSEYLVFSANWNQKDFSTVTGVVDFEFMGPMSRVMKNPQCFRHSVIALLFCSTSVLPGAVPCPIVTTSDAVIWVATTPTATLCFYLQGHAIINENAITISENLKRLG
jgi:hypothetical protein